jgi:hypothetical protein
LIKGFPTTTTTTTKQNVDPAVYYVYSRVKKFLWLFPEESTLMFFKKAINIIYVRLSVLVGNVPLNRILQSKQKHLRRCTALQHSAVRQFKTNPPVHVKKITTNILKKSKWHF